MKLHGIRFGFCLAWIAIMAHDLSAEKPFVIDFGVRGGVLPGQPLEANPYSSQYNSLPPVTLDNNYGAFGPTFVVQLVNHVDVRFEWVYKRFSYRLYPSIPPLAKFDLASSVRGHSWEYPVLATYKFGTGKVRPFAGGGMNLGGTVTSHSTNVTGQISFPHLSTTTETTNSTPLQDAYHIIGGLEWRFRLFTARPELRYTHWSADKVSDALLANKPNQFEIVVGFTAHPFQGR